MRVCEVCVCVWERVHVCVCVCIFADILLYRAKLLQSKLRKAVEGHPFVKVLGDKESPIAVLSLPHDQIESQKLARQLRQEV